MPASLLQAMQQRWNVLPQVVTDEENQQQQEPQAKVEQSTVAVPFCSIESGVARLVELIATYKFTVAIYSGGGCGFRFPQGRVWKERHWHVVGEFSDLWLGPAGDAFRLRFADRIPLKELPVGVANVLTAPEAEVL